MSTKNNIQVVRWVVLFAATVSACNNRNHYIFPNYVERKINHMFCGEHKADMYYCVFSRTSYEGRRVNELTFYERNKANESLDALLDNPGFYIRACDGISIPVVSDLDFEFYEGFFDEKGGRILPSSYMGGGLTLYFNDSGYCQWVLMQ